MRLFVYEYTCAIATDSALRHEGEAMLRAVLADFAAIPHIRPVTMLAEGHNEIPQVDCRFATPANEVRLFRALVLESDLALIIAPESGGVLAQRCGWVRSLGGRLLGSDADALKVTSDKLILAHWLTACGILTPDSADAQMLWSGRFPVVCKPRDGAGSQATFIVRLGGELAEMHRQLHAEMTGTEFIVQPFVEGRAASVAFLLGPGAVVPLVPAWQHLTTDGRLRYCGGTLPIPEPYAERAATLALEAVRSVPGLRGFVGVDLVLGDAGDYVIEINPRLTTSYLGLRRLARFNLAEAMLDVFQGTRDSVGPWGTEAVSFGVT